MNATRASLGYRNHKARIWAGETPDKYLRVARYVSGRNVLEVGSAEGVLALELAARGHRVTAVELRPERHDEALRLNVEVHKSFNVRFLCGDILDHLDLLIGADTLVAVRSIYYLRDAAPRVLEEAYGVGVKEVVLCGNRNRAAQAALEPNTDLGRFNRLASHDGMADLVTAAGFHVVQMVGAGDPIVVARR